LVLAVFSYSCILMPSCSGQHMAKKTDAGQIKVRIPKELQRRIQREADRNGQTINAEILARLAQSFEVKKQLDVVESALTNIHRSIADMQTALLGGWEKELERRAKELSEDFGGSYDENLRKLKDELRPRPAEALGVQDAEQKQEKEKP
jgi:Arc-like DNA binding domain